MTAALDVARRLRVALERIAGGYEVDPVGYAGVSLEVLPVHDIDELGRAMGRVLADRNRWRHVVNLARAYLDLPALTTEGCSEDDTATTVEAVRCVVRDSDLLADYRQRLKERDATVERLTEQERDDRRTINSLRAAVDDLERQLYALTGGAP